MRYHCTMHARSWLHLDGRRNVVRPPWSWGFTAYWNLKASGISTFPIVRGSGVWSHFPVSWDMQVKRIKNHYRNQIPPGKIKKNGCGPKKRFLNKAPRFGTTTRKPPSFREVLRAAMLHVDIDWLCMCSSRLLLGRHRWTWGERYVWVPIGVSSLLLFHGD